MQPFKLPHVQLRKWSIYELPSGQRFFGGFSLTHGEGRVSTEILEFDIGTLTGKTASGRSYELLEHPSWHSEAALALHNWKAQYAISEADVKNISAEIWAEHLKIANKSS